MKRAASIKPSPDIHYWSVHIRDTEMFCSRAAGQFVFTWHVLSVFCRLVSRVWEQWRELHVQLNMCEISLLNRVVRGRRGRSVSLSSTFPRCLTQRGWWCCRDWVCWWNTGRESTRPSSAFYPRCAEIRRLREDWLFAAATGGCVLWDLGLIGFAVYMHQQI